MSDTTTASLTLSRISQRLPTFSSGLYFKRSYNWLYHNYVISCSLLGLSYFLINGVSGLCLEDGPEMIVVNVFVSCKFISIKLIGWCYIKLRTNLHSAVHALCSVNIFSTVHRSTKHVFIVIHEWRHAPRGTSHLRKGTMDSQIHVANSLYVTGVGLETFRNTAVLNFARFCIWSWK